MVQFGAQSGGGEERPDGDPPYELSHEQPAVDDAEPEGERLALDEEERLPWLESADDDDGYDESDNGRLMLFLVLGLVLLVAAVGGIWWASHRGGDQELQADGSVIEAPVEPYKQAPKDPGGKTFAGTGDTSFAVSEGQSRQAKLDQGAPVPGPTATASGKPATTPGATATPAPTGVGVQVAAYSSQASAEAGWTRLSQQYASVLSGVHHRVVEGKADIGTVYRLQVVAGDAAAAQTLCGKLKGAGLPCQVKN